MEDLFSEYVEINNLLVLISECIEITHEDKLLEKLFELKHWLIDEKQKIDDFMELQNKLKGD